MDNVNRKHFELKVDNALVFAVVGFIVVGKVAREAIKAVTKL